MHIYTYIYKCTHIHIYKTLPIIFLRKMNSIIKTTGKTKPKHCLKKKMQQEICRHPKNQ